MILIFKFTGMSRLTVDADKILLITILAASGNHRLQRLHNLHSFIINIQDMQVL